MKIYLAVVFALVGILHSRVQVAAQSLSDPTTIDNLATVPWMRVPPPARQALAAYTGNSSLAGVQQGVLNGAVVYRAEYQRNGQPIEILVAADGSPYAPFNNMAWNAAPMTVPENYLNQGQAETTAQNQIAGTVYNSSTGNYGQRYREQVAQSGSSPGYNQSQAGAASSYAQSSPPAGSVITESAGASRPSSPNAVSRRTGITRIEQIPFANLSQAAQQTVISISGGARVFSTEPTVIDGILCYEVKYDASGQVASMYVSNDGQIIR